MKLYHGTSARHLQRILREGLKPRGKKNGNWKHTVDSHPEAVYMTVAYPLYYALCATRGAKDNDGLILEIDATRLNPFALCPDEDFLGQALHGRFPGESLKRVTERFRDGLVVYSETWTKSIEHLGNCCYMGTAPVEAISRYAIVPDISDWVQWSDPTISLMNFKIMGGYYKALSASLFGDKTDYESDPMSRFGQLPPPEQYAKIKVVDLRETVA